ncbi:hypothetical protein EII34_15000 [Arachnia propionica]|uniref:Uncharacterized protein n=1 Tax=Arachnia propionica TaxID=1750 RepID=A0A3P1T117_9ACTN|nr:hypothetical protein [Arachnia propionica]RRD03212.1 hypothetical protein EII34_15000 [Arachnia propionica]
MTTTAIICCIASAAISIAACIVYRHWTRQTLRQLIILMDDNLRALRADTVRQAAQLDLLRERLDQRHPLPNPNGTKEPHA